MSFASSYIPKPEKGRRFAVADIHGCLRTFAALVEKFALCKEDQLFCLGDYVNRGPDSQGVLRYLQTLQKEGYSVFALRGNHEQMLIEKLQRTDTLSDKSHLVGFRSLFANISPEQRKWLEALPYYFELDRFFLVHGAFNTSAAEPLEDREYMLWERKTKNAQAFLKGKQLVHGHTVHPLSAIREAIEGRYDCIPLDNGCYQSCGGRAAAPEEGALCALELDNAKLYVQENLD